MTRNHTTYFSLHLLFYLLFVFYFLGKPNHREFTNSMVYSSPELKLGVRFGDSDRMRFPQEEKLESTNRLRRARNGFTSVNLYKDALPSNDVLYPVIRLQK